MTVEHQGLSPDEIALLASDDLEGGVPKEDESEVANAAALAADVEEAAATAGAPEPKADAEEDEGEPAPAAPAAPPAEAPVAAPAPAPVAAPAPAPALPQYKAVDVAALDAKRAELVTKEEEAFTKLNDGTIDTDEYLKTKREVSGQLDQLLVQRTLAEANAQTAARAAEQAQQNEATAIAAIMESAKAAGTVDYFTDTKAQVLFDWALNTAVADPDNAGKSMTDLLNLAHGVVLQRRGIATAAPASAPAAVKNDPRSVDKSLIPPTLSRVPPAADATIAGDEFSHLSGLTGQALEKAVSAMTAEQQDRWLN